MTNYKWRKITVSRISNLLFSLLTHSLSVSVSVSFFQSLNLSSISWKKGVGAVVAAAAAATVDVV